MMRLDKTRMAEYKSKKNEEEKTEEGKVNKKRQVEK